MNNFIPPTYAGNLVRVSQANHASTLVAPPAGRWKAIHNTTNGDVTIKAPGNEVYAYLGDDGVSRSIVHAPGSLGKLDGGTALASFDGSVKAVDTGTTANFINDTSTSGAVNITRGGVVNPSGVTAPSFSGINWTSSALTALAVNAEGEGLKEGDIITFPLTTNDDILITFVVGQDDLQLSAGYYQTVATTSVDVLTLAAGDTVFVSLGSFEIGTSGAVVTAYFG